MANLDLGALRISIGVDNKEANKQIQETKGNMDGAAKSAQSFLSNFGSGFVKTMKAAGAAVAAVVTATGALVTAVVDAATKTADACDTIDKASQRMGVDAEYYQKLDYAAGQCGVSMDTMEKAAKALQKSGSELSFEQAIQQVMSYTNEADRAAAASELFGDKVAYDMTPLLNAGEEGLTALMAQAEEYGLVMGEDAVAAGASFNDSIALLTKTVNGAKNQLASQFFPSLNKVANGIAGMASGIDGADKEFKEGLAEFISQFETTVKQLLAIAPSIIQAIVTGITSALPGLVNTAIDVIMTLMGFLLDNLPMLIDTGFQVIIELITGITQAITDEGFISTIIEIVITVVNTILDNLPMVLEVGLELIVALVQGIMEEGLPMLLEALPEIINKMVNLLTSPDSLGKILKAAVTIIGALVRGIISAIPQVLSGIGQVLTNIVQNISQAMATMKNKGKELITKLASGITDKISYIKEKIGNLWEKMKEKFTSAFSGIKQIGKDLISGLWNGINDKVDWLIQKIKDIGADIIAVAKRILGIKSPSKVFRQIGDFLVEGFGEGVEDNAYKAINAVADLGNSVQAAFQPSLSYDAYMGGYSPFRRDTSGSGNPGASGNSIVQNNYFTTKETSPYEQQLEIYRLNRELAGVYA